MIVRVVTATVPMNVAPRFHHLLRTQLGELLAYDGLRYVKLARRLDGPTEEVVLIEEWRDPEAMYAWTGPDLQKARLPGGAHELVLGIQITHYEALDIEPDEAWPPPPIAVVADP